jgi:hypothetical protein
MANTGNVANFFLLSFYLSFLCVTFQFLRTLHALDVDGGEGGYSKESKNMRMKRNNLVNVKAQYERTCGRVMYGVKYCT